MVGPLKTTINLNDEDIQLLVNYFENSNGQVQYGEFCQMVHNDKSDLHEGKIKLITYLPIKKHVTKIYT